jgi:site-specific DNA recombinase
MATSAHTNAAIYCRVSTRQQAEDGSSLDSQEVACRRLAASQGFTITQVFKEDFPGTELARPMLDQLRGGVKSGAYAAVFCYATDRLSRSPVHLALIAEECQKCEVELVFVTEPLDSSPEGQLLTFVRGWAAQLEREKIKHRTIRGKAARIASGRLPQGTGRTGAAYGYRYDKATGRRTIEPAEAVVITELFELCATGLSTYKLADRLNQAELPSPLGTKWHPRTVLNILRNPIYMGVTYFNRRQRVHISGKRHTYVDRPQSEWAVIDGATPAIVDADLFRTVQARLDQPLVRPAPEYTRYLLSGFLRCSCGGPACGHELQRNSKYRYYRCINTVPRTNRPRTCDAKGVRVSVLEPLAWAEVCKVIEDPETILAELRSRQGATTALDEEIARVRTTIKTLDAQKQRALRLFTIAEADDADVKRELGRINKLSLQAQSRLAELEGRRAVSAQFEPLAEKVKEYCALARDRLDQLTFEQKREVLEVLQAELTLEKDGALRLLLTLPTGYMQDDHTNVRRASA